MKLHKENKVQLFYVNHIPNAQYNYEVHQYVFELACVSTTAQVILHANRLPQVTKIPMLSHFGYD